MKKFTTPLAAAALAAAMTLAPAPAKADVGTVVLTTVAVSVVTPKAQQLSRHIEKWGWRSFNPKSW